MQVAIESEQLYWLEQRVKELQMLLSAMALMAKDDKDKVRINKNIINKVNDGKIQDMNWHTNAAGAVIIEVVMASPAKK